MFASFGLSFFDIEIFSLRSFMTSILPLKYAFNPDSAYPNPYNCSFQSVRSCDCDLLNCYTLQNIFALFIDIEQDLGGARWCSTPLWLVEPLLQL